MLSHKIWYKDTLNQVDWYGKQAADKSEFSKYLHDKVFGCLSDSIGKARLEADLRALASTGMATDTLKNLLLASRVEREPWEVGEALAECLLHDEFGIIWPWNNERDKKTPKASLPGADLIGFTSDPDYPILAIGEVKTSSDNNCPPNVMYGRSGMTHQLDTLCANLQIQYCIISWLYYRCKNTESWPFFQKALTNYLSSRGKAILLFGLLMRDTSPNELDVKSRGQELGKKLDVPTKLEIHVWYLPLQSNQWWPMANGDLA